MVDRNSPDRSNAAYLAADGTDPLTYNNVSSRTGTSGKLRGAFNNVINITSQAKIPADANALTMLTNEVIGTILGDWRKRQPTPCPASISAGRPNRRLQRPEAQGQCQVVSTRLGSVRLLSDRRVS